MFPGLYLLSLGTSILQNLERRLYNAFLLLIRHTPL